LLSARRGRKFGNLLSTETSSREGQSVRESRCMHPGLGDRNKSVMFIGVRQLHHDDAFASQQRQEIFLPPEPASGDCQRAPAYR
jgi:hypothetical protein